MDKLASANISAILKLASVYDMYPHETYALRYNSNNPAYKEREIFVDRDYDDSTDIKATYYDTLTLMPAENASNQMSRQPYMGQYNLLNDRPNIEGTGHGIPLSTRPNNPQSYN